MSETRCPAAHPGDPTPCVGPHDAVLILDKDKAGAYGCEHHAARLLASLDGATVHTAPGGPKDAAIRVFQAADDIRPFCWFEDAPRTRPDQLSHRESRRPAAPDLHGVILAAVESFQWRPRPVGYHQQLAEHLTQAVAPLVPYREVWSAELPPGGRVCGTCGQPVESEPCPEHAPGRFTPWKAAVAGLNALVDADIAFHIEPDGHISNPLGREHIEWDRTAKRWVLSLDEDGQPVAVEEPAACGKCRQPFDPTDTRFDGRGQHGTTPFCRRCVDRCHESTDAFHVCPVCDPSRRGGEGR